MVTPENFTNAIMRGLADLRSSLERAAARFEAEARKAGQAAEAEDVDVPGRSTMAGDQLQGIVDMIRSEAVTVATQLADGLHEIVDDLCEARPGSTFGGEGTAATSTSDGPATVDTPAVETSGPNRPARRTWDRRRPARRRLRPRSLGPRRPRPRRRSKKTSAKKSGAKKAGKKAGRRRRAPRSPGPRSPAEEGDGQEDERPRSPGPRSPARRRRGQEGEREEVRGQVVRVGKKYGSRKAGPAKYGRLGRFGLVAGTDESPTGRYPP